MNFSLIEKNPIKFLNNSSKKQIEDVILKCSEVYYNSEKGETLLSDQVFDILKDYLEEKYPNSKVVKNIGSSIKSSKVKLPIYMGSMNKKKTEKEIQNWKKDYQGEVVISDKLDGISFLLESKKGKFKIYTRGNGTEGKDISKIQNYVELSKKVSKKNFIVRGEILVTKKNYKNVKGEFKNPRSFVAGMSNQKDFGKRADYLKLLNFVCYELVEPKLKPSEQFEYLASLGFKVVYNYKLPDFTFIDLKDKFLERKEKSDYEVDGLIITNNKLNSRNKDGNPKYSFAFKMDLEYAITTVINVEWNASKLGKLKPIVNIEPTILCGTTNRKATGNNADFIVKNGIGPGAVVKMIKGGEIIPKIVEVLEKTEPQLPEVDYVWNETKKEIILQNINDDKDVKIKKIISFFKELDVKNIGPGIFKKMFQNGFDTIKKIINIQKEDLIKLDGIKEKSSNKIFGSIHNVIDNPLEIERVIAGTCILDSVGYKILKKITSIYPDLFQSNLEITVEMLNKIPSIQDKTAKKIIESLAEIRKFIYDHSEFKYKENQVNINEKKLNIVITGKRDKNVLAKIDSEGYILQNIVNKKTDLLIVETEDIVSSKIKKAKELNIKIITNEIFIKEY